MARPKRIDTELVQKARSVVAQTTDLQELREAQSILLPALHSATLEETASLLGVSRASVHRLQTRFRAKSRGTYVAKPHGGRGRVNMSFDQERAFLAPWAEQAKEGGVLVVSVMRADLSQHLGRPVAASVLYRLLARHGWRKVAPDTRHPKTDPALQEEWKENSRRRWMPC